MRQFNTLTGFLLSKSSNPSINDIVEFSGYDSAGDGGGAQWKHNGVTGQTPSQSPAQLGDALLNDGNGNQYELVVDGVLFFSSIGVLADFGDVSDQFNAGVSHIKTNGYIGELPSGNIYARNIRLEGGVKHWSLKGQGKRMTTIRQTTGEGTLLIGNAGSSVGYDLSGFTVDCRYSELNPVSANNGISVADTNNVLIADVEIIDYLEDAILIFSTSAGSHRNATIINCNCDGNTKAGNGFLISSYENGRIIDSFAENVRSTEGSGPGYGVQLKNECVGGGIFGGGAKNCIAGAAFGFAGQILGVSNSQVKGFNSVQCDGAYYGLATNCYIEIICDMKSQGGSAITLDQNSTGNKIQAVVSNLATAKGAVRYRGNAINNSSSIVCQGLDSSGSYAICDSLVSNNHTLISGYSKSDIPTNGYRNLSSFSGTTSNSLIINSLVPVHTQLVIASNQILVENKAYSMVRVDTSGGNDDLITINSDFEDGQVLKIVNVSNSRVVTIKNSGNIKTKDNLDLLLNDKSKIYSFLFLSSLSKFVEI